ncbi:hypothetical protein [Massilia sp. DD77]|uniref:hypothetical protein n=1 Tax=Massilia sp. DD77 TaxID=3109349 RepID=UPI002FFEB065
MISQPRYLQLVRLSAWYDLFVTAGFATPWTFALIHGALAALAHGSGLPGSLPSFEPAHVLMANLLGSVVVVWSLLRLHATQALYGRYDALARFLFAAWQLYAVAHGATWLILGFTAAELAFGVAQLLPLRNQSGVPRVDPIPNKC